MWCSIWIGHTRESYPSARALYFISRGSWIAIPRLRPNRSYRRSEGVRGNQERFARLSKPQRWRVSTVKLLFALILLFAVTPFIENLPNGDFVESGLITLVMVASLVAVGRDRGVLFSAAVFFVPAIAGKWLNHF